MPGIEEQGSAGGKLRASGRDHNLPIRGLSRLLGISLVSYVLFAYASLPELAAPLQDSAGEYELKAAMLFNLMRFVQWPPSSYSDSQAPAVLCVLGWDPF